MIHISQLPKDGNAVSALYLSADGPIPSHMLEAARAIDKAWRRKRPPQQVARVRIGTVTMKRATAIDLMALQIAKCAANGCVREVDLAVLGFTPQQIADWAPEAYRKALAENPGLADMLGA